MKKSDKEIALAAKPALLEPPIAEYIASFLYRVFGGENMMIPRLMSIIYWMVAGVFLYLLAKDLISPDGGIIAAAFFLFLPYGVRASRSFQPDPLMIMFFTASVYFIYRYYKNTSVRLLVIASVVSAMAIIVKPVSLMPIFGAFFAVRLVSRDIRKIFLRSDLYIFAAISLIPTFLYYGYEIFSAGLLKNQANFTFIPSLILKPFFWKGWYQMVSTVLGIWPVLLSLLGICLLSSNVKRFFLIGLWAGYLIHGLYFTFHIHTHDYYQLILIPIVALSLSQAFCVLFNGVVRAEIFWRFAVWCLFVLCILFTVRESMLYLGNKGYDKQVRIYEEIGDKVNHDMNILSLSEGYGNGLMYHGKVVGLEEWQWPVAYDFNAEERMGSKVQRGEELLNTKISEKSPDYFIITDMEDLKEQNDLKEALDARFPKVAEASDYIIYDLRKDKNVN